MAANYAEVLSAFFDGEEVDSEALAESLQQPDAIDLLQEFARLRRTVQADASRPDEEFSEAVRERLAYEEKRRRSRRHLLRMSVAASLVLASGAGGFSVRALLERRAPTPSSEATQMVPVRPTTSAQAVIPGAKNEPVQVAVPVKQKPAAANDRLRMWIKDWKDLKDNVL